MSDDVVGMKRKVNTYRKKLRLLTNAQHRQSIQFSVYLKQYGKFAMPVSWYCANGWA